MVTQHHYYDPRKVLGRIMFIVLVVIIINSDHTYAALKAPSRVVKEEVIEDPVALSVSGDEALQGGHFQRALKIFKQLHSIHSSAIEAGESSLPPSLQCQALQGCYCFVSFVHIHRPL
jgi:hypothetical protein